MHRKITIFILTLIITIFVVIYFKYNLHQYITLDNIKVQKKLIQSLYNKHNFLFIIIFISAYILSVIITVPLGYLLLCSVAGFLFNFYFALFLTIISNSIGTLLTFFSARFLFRTYVETKFKKFFIIVNKRLKEEGELYLFFIRLIPVIPVFITNTVMGLTKMRWTHYFLISQIGMLPELVIFIYIGKELDKINKISEIFSVENVLIISIFIFFVIAFYFLYKKIRFQIK